MIKITCDTNILISALINGSGNPAKLLKLIFEKKIKLCLSPSILAELTAALHYPHLFRKYRLNETVIQNFVKILTKKANIVSGNYQTDYLNKSDPKDNKVLACALEGKVDFIITGDKKHLLPLKQFHKIQILSVDDFLKLQSKKPF